MASLAEAVEIPDSSDDEAVKAVKWTGTGKADAPLKIESDSDGEPAAKRSRTAPAAPAPAPVKAARPRSPDSDGSPTARAFMPPSDDDDDDFLLVPGPQRNTSPAPLLSPLARPAPATAAGSGKKPPGLFRLGVRRGGGPDPNGSRSLPEDKMVEILRRLEVDVLADMRSGRGLTGCGRKLKTKSRWTECDISHPKWACDCSIVAVCARGGAEYRWVGKPTDKRYPVEDDSRGKNLGGSRIANLPYDKKPIEKVSGDIRRAYLDPTNTQGRWCVADDKNKTRHMVKFNPESYANLQELAALSKVKRVALLCVEDELAICHVKVLIDIMLRDRMIGSATAIEPVSMTPGAGWANIVCDCSRDWKVELDARKAARR